MNNVFISGIVKGEAVAVPAKVREGEQPKPDNVLRTIVIVDSKGNSKEFKALALAGELGDKFKGIPSGKRVILDGRIGSEELEPKSGIYQGVISVRRLIAVIDAMNGIDVAVGTVGGAASCEGLRFTESGTPIANLNIKNTRTFTKRDGSSPVTVTTYLNAVAWTDKAQQISQHLPLVDTQVVVSGMLVPSEYKSTKHGGAMISKIEVWADEVSIGGATSSDTPAPAPSRPAPAPRAPRATKGSDDNLGF